MSNVLADWMAYENFGRHALHRVVGKFKAPCILCREVTWIITKGDNCKHPDPQAVPMCAVTGKVIKIIKKGTMQYEEIMKLLELKGEVSLWS